VKAFHLGSLSGSSSKNSVSFCRWRATERSETSTGESSVYVGDIVGGKLLNFQNRIRAGDSLTDNRAHSGVYAPGEAGRQQQPLSHLSSRLWSSLSIDESASRAFHGIRGPSRRVPDLILGPSEEGTQRCEFDATGLPARWLSVSARTAKAVPASFMKRPVLEDICFCLFTDVAGQEPSDVWLLISHDSPRCSCTLFLGTPASCRTKTSSPVATPSLLPPNGVPSSRNHILISVRALQPFQLQVIDASLQPPSACCRLKASLSMAACS